MLSILIKIKCIKKIKKEWFKKILEYMDFIDKIGSALIIKYVLYIQFTKNNVLHSKNLFFLPKKHKKCTYT